MQNIPSFSEKQRRSVRTFRLDETWIEVGFHYSLKTHYAEFHTVTTDQRGRLEHSDIVIADTPRAALKKAVFKIRLARNPGAAKVFEKMKPDDGVLNLEKLNQMRQKLMAQDINPKVAAVSVKLKPRPEVERVRDGITLNFNEVWTEKELEQYMKGTL